MVQEEKKHKCDKCFAALRTSRGLQIHKTRLHPWIPPPAPPDPREHVNFVDLYSKSWGKSMTHTEKETPSMETLQMTMLMKIIEILDDIKKEISRTKTIN